MPDRTRTATVLLVLSMLTGGVTHGWNAFRYPTTSMTPQLNWCEKLALVPLKRQNRSKNW